MVIGAISALLFLWIFLMKLLLQTTIPKENVGSVLAGAIILPIFYSLFAIIIGGFLGIIIYNVFIRKTAKS